MKKTILKKEVIQPLTSDDQLFDFFKRYVKVRKKPYSRDKISRYEKRITIILNQSGLDYESTPVLSSILKWRLSRAEFKVFMYVFLKSEKANLNRSINMVDDEQDEEVESNPAVSVNELIDIFSDEGEEIKNAIFDEGSRLNINGILKVAKADSLIFSSGSNTKVGLSSGVKKYFKMIKNVCKNRDYIEKDKRLTKVDTIRDDLDDVLDRYFSADMGNALRREIQDMEKINTYLKGQNQSTAIQDIDLLFPVLVLCGDVKMEVEYLIRGIARFFRRDLLEYKMTDIYNYVDDEFDEYSESEEQKGLKSVLDVSILNDYVVHIIVKKEKDIKILNHFLDLNPKLRRNPVIVSSPKMINLDILGLDGSRYSYKLYTFNKTDEETLKKMWIDRIPPRYYNGAGYDTFAKRFPSFNLERIDLSVKKAVEKMRLDGRSILEDKEIIDSAEKIQQIKIVNDDEDDFSPFGSDTGISGDIKICKERLSDVILNESTLIDVNRILKVAKDMDRFYAEIFDNRISYGKGIKIMFYGAPGTGKTMTARAISSELNMPMIELSLNKLMNPLVGMTEKIIVEYFETAKKNKAILYIDECDSLIMSRDRLSHSWEFSHINVLLKQIEEFDGILIMSTNFEEIRDRAINRRMHFFIKFEMPDYEMRKRLIKALIPERFINSINIDGVCQMEFNGGDIRNIWIRLGLRLFCNENINTEMFISEIRAEREKYAGLLRDQNRCGF